MKYKIYYAPLLDTTMNLIATIDSPFKTNFTHDPKIKSTFPEYVTMAGCYSITAVDSFENETRRVRRVCVDACPLYNLPNVFTPNNDGNNDLFRPINFEKYAEFIDRIDIKIYNRWGKQVFESVKPEIDWDGTDINTKKKLPDGVYYYVCDVYERRINGIEPRYLIGFIHIFNNPKSKHP